MILKTQKFKCNNRTFEILSIFSNKMGAKIYEVVESDTGETKKIDIQNWTELVNKGEIELI